MPIQLFKDGHQCFEDCNIRLLDALDSPEYFEDINLPTEAQIMKAAEYLGVDPKYLFVVDFWATPFFYYHNHIRCDIVPPLEIEHLKQAQLQRRIQQMTHLMNDCIQSGNFERAFSLMDKRNLFESYQDLYEIIPDAMKFDLFLDIYTRSEYGFNDLQPESLSQIFSHRTHSNVKQQTRKWLKSLQTKDGFVTVYRGAGTLSASYDEAYSWTTDEKIGHFFANRFGKGTLYKAKVHVSKVVAYLADKEEKEVIIFPENIIDVQVI